MDDAKARLTGGLLVLATAHSRYDAMRVRPRYRPFGGTLSDRAERNGRVGEKRPRFPARNDASAGTSSIEWCRRAEYRFNGTDPALVTAFEVTIPGPIRPIS
jgi:hypothetical protein